MREVILKLTPTQARLLLWTMDDYLNVSEDRGVVRFAKQLRAKLLEAGASHRKGPR